MTLWGCFTRRCCATETDLLVEIVRTLEAGLTVPVTCKIRVLESGLDDTLALCKALERAGCSMITVHGRTKVRCGGVCACTGHGA